MKAKTGRAFSPEPSRSIAGSSAIKLSSAYALRLSATNLTALQKNRSRQARSFPQYPRGMSAENLNRGRLSKRTCKINDLFSTREEY